jgi:hypothetical protein
VPPDLAAAREFVVREGRVLEQRLFAAVFDGADPRGVVDALLGFRNSDGGFGHGLEPDKRCPDSQPLDAQIAFETMDAAGHFEGELARAACDFLTSVADERGAVPPVLPSIAAYPRADHWGDGDYPSGLNPTAAIAGLLHKHGVEHPWRDRATRYCLDEIERAPPEEAHTLRAALLLVEYLPGAEPLAPLLSERIPTAAWFRADPHDPEYGLTPLHFAPTPDSPWRSLFADEDIEGHLDRLTGDQADDGGWPLTWEPPSQASALEWRAIETLRAVRVLRAYGRL